MSDEDDFAKSSESKKRKPTEPASKVMKSKKAKKMSPAEEEEEDDDTAVEVEGDTDPEDMDEEESAGEKKKAKKKVASSKPKKSAKEKATKARPRTGSAAGAAPSGTGVLLEVDGGGSASRKGKPSQKPAGDPNRRLLTDIRGAPVCYSRKDTVVVSDVDAKKLDQKDPKDVIRHTLVWNSADSPFIPQFPVRILKLQPYGLGSGRYFDLEDEKKVLRAHEELDAASAPSAPSASKKKKPEADLMSDEAEEKGPRRRRKVNYRAISQTQLPYFWLLDKKQNVFAVHWDEMNKSWAYSRRYSQVTGEDVPEIMDIPWERDDSVAGHQFFRQKLPPMPELPPEPSKDSDASKKENNTSKKVEVSKKSTDMSKKSAEVSKKVDVPTTKRVLPAEQAPAPIPSSAVDEKGEPLN